MRREKWPICEISASLCFWYHPPSKISARARSSCKFAVQNAGKELRYISGVSPEQLLRVVLFLAVAPRSSRCRTRCRRFPSFPLLSFLLVEVSSACGTARRALSNMICGHVVESGRRFWMYKHGHRCRSRIRWRIFVVQISAAPWFYSGQTCVNIPMNGSSGG